MLPSSAELTYFLEVSSSLNISRAAETLGISQPSLSLAMKRLEESVGATLFMRHKHGVSLTHAGKQLGSHARQLLQYWEKTKSGASASLQEIRGEYTLGCHSTIAIYMVSKCLADLLERYPKLEIHLKNDISRRITDQVINLSLDIGVVVNPIEHPDLIIQKLCNDEVSFWVGAGSRATQDIHSQDAVTLCDIELIQPQSLLKQIKKMGIKPKRILTMNSLEVVASMTANGCGIGILPCRVAEAMYLNQLKRIPNMPVYSDEVCLVYRHENRNILAIQTVAKSIKALFEHNN